MTNTYRIQTTDGQITDEAARKSTAVLIAQDRANRMCETFHVVRWDDHSGAQLVAVQYPGL